MFVFGSPLQIATFSNFSSGALTFSGALGSRSQTREAVAGNLTVERADYKQEMDCHYFDSWAVDRWSLCRSWLVLMCQLKILVFFRIFATFAVPFRLVLSAKHGPEIAGPTAEATDSTRHCQPKCFLFRVQKQCIFLLSDNHPTADSWKYCTTVHFTYLVSNRFQPTMF